MGQVLQRPADPHHRKPAAELRHHDGPAETAAVQEGGAGDAVDQGLVQNFLTGLNMFDVSPHVVMGAHLRLDVLLVCEHEQRKSGPQRSFDSLDR